MAIGTVREIHRVGHMVGSGYRHDRKHQRSVVQISGKRRSECILAKGVPRDFSESKYRSAYVW
jgi:hypothetical protein